MDVEKIKQKVKEVILKAAETYTEEKYKIAYAILAYPHLGGNPKNGVFLLEKDPSCDLIELCYSPAEFGYGDLGTTIGSVSMEYFNLDHIAGMIKVMYDSYVDEWQ